MITHFEGINIAEVDRYENGFVLDFGCGSGLVTRFLIERGFRVTAFDIDQSIGDRLNALLTPAERARFSFFSSSLEELDAMDGQYDLIICREVLEHVPDRNAVIAFFARKLKPHGRLIVSVPTEKSERLFQFFDPKWLQKSEHTEILSESDLEKMFLQHGLQLQAKEGTGSKWSMFWLMLAPFRVDHVMGNPVRFSIGVRLALRLVNFLDGLTAPARIGNRLFPKSRVYYLSRSLPTVLCVYDYPDWILGRWAFEVERTCADSFEVVSISYFASLKNPALAKRLVQDADCVITLLPHAFEFFYGFHPRKIGCAVHHWVDFGSLYALAIDSADFIVTGASEWKQRIIEKNPSASVFVVRSGFPDSYSVEPREWKESARDCLKLGFFAKRDSNENDRKGTRHLVELFTEIVERGLINQYSLTLTGNGWSDFVKELRKKGVNVEYYPDQPASLMESLYRSIDIYLMLSDVEGGPATVSEAMAAGCVVLARKIGLAADAIVQGENGFFVDTSLPGNVVSTLESLRESMDTLHAVSRRAQETADKYLRYSVTFREFKDILNRYVDPSRNGVKTIVASERRRIAGRLRGAGFSSKSR